MAFSAFRAFYAAFSIQAMSRKHIPEKVYLKFLTAIRAFKMMAGRFFCHTDNIDDQDYQYNGYDIYEFWH